MQFQFFPYFRDREMWARDKNQMDKEMNARLVPMKKRATVAGRIFHHIQVYNLQLPILKL